MFVFPFEVTQQHWHSGNGTGTGNNKRFNNSHIKNYFDFCFGSLATATTMLMTTTTAITILDDIYNNVNIKKVKICTNNNTTLTTYNDGLTMAWHDKQSGTQRVRERERERENLTLKVAAK